MGKLRAALVFAMILGAVLALGGCASGEAAAPTELNGTWVLESFGGVTELEPADPAVTSELTLRSGEVSGNGGVNSFSGAYETPADSKISFGPLAATSMAGSPEAMEQETKLFKALDDTRNFEFNEGKLVFSDTGNNVTVVFAPK